MRQVQNLHFSTSVVPPCLLLTRCHSCDQEPGFQKQRNVLLIEDGCFQLCAELSNGAFLIGRPHACMSLSVLLFIKDAIAIILTCDALKMLYTAEENFILLISISDTFKFFFLHFEHFICAQCFFSPLTKSS